MKILVINAGSSSLKYQLIDMDDESVLAKGNCERIGMEDGIFTHKTNDGREKHVTVSMPDHTAAFTQVKNALIDPEVGVLKSLDEVSAVGHRIVQGGALFSKSVLVDDKVIEGIESLIPLAPLHNKAHVQGIRACIEVFGKSVPEVVVFDTAFHSTMPPKAYMYPIPYEYYEKYAVRRYGFHGTSHRYVSHRCAELMGQDLKDLKMITCHLGNGSSISAIQDGKVIDTSMGLTPLDGFMMGSRTGTLDPSVVTFVMEKENATILDLFSGVIVLVIGIFLFMNPTVVVKLLTLMLGAFILVDSIWMMRGSMKLKKRGQGVWKAFLVESLIFIGLGVLILVNPFSEIRMIVQISGCIFVANGVLDIIFYLILKHGLKKEIQDGSAGDGKKENKVTDADMAVKDAETPDSVFEPAKKVDTETVESGAENTGAQEELANQEKQANQEEQTDQTDQEKQADQKQEEEEILEEWKD